jgi:hypothetical protein
MGATSKREELTNPNAQTVCGESSPGPLLDYWKGAVVRNLCKIPNFYPMPKSPAERP